MKSLETNPESWFFSAKGKHTRPFSWEEMRLVRIYESQVRMNLPKNKQKSFAVDYPWKDSSKEKKGTKKMPIDFVKKILGIK